MLTIKSIDVPNYNLIYKKNKKIFKEFEYFYKRYKIPYSIVYIKNIDNSKFNEKVENLIRYGDKYIKLNENEYIIFLFHTDVKNAFQTYYRIEKILKNSIKFGISGIENLNDTKTSIDILKKAFENYQLNY